MSLADDSQAVAWQPSTVREALERHLEHLKRIKARAEVELGEEHTTHTTPRQLIAAINDVQLLLSNDGPVMDCSTLRPAAVYIVSEPGEALACRRSVSHAHAVGRRHPSGFLPHQAQQEVRPHGPTADRSHPRRARLREHGRRWRRTGHDVAPVWAHRCLEAHRSVHGAVHVSDGCDRSSSFLHLLEPPRPPGRSHLYVVVGDYCARL